MPYKPIAQLRTPEQFAAYLAQVGADLPFDSALAAPSPFAESYTLPGGFTLGNRFCITFLEKVSTPNSASTRPVAGGVESDTVAVPRYGVGAGKDTRYRVRPSAQ